MVRMSEGHFRTNKESSIWPQNDHAKFVGAFHLSRRVSDENRARSISIRFFKIKDPFGGRSFLMCSHHPFFGTNKNRILENGSCERALKHCLLLVEFKILARTAKRTCLQPKFRLKKLSKTFRINLPKYD